MADLSGPGGSTRGAAFARAGLMGNPSDGYGGNAIACVVRNFCAVVTCRPATDVVGAPDRLLDATVTGLSRYCRKRGQTLPGPRPHLEAVSDVPLKVGLAGSSAIVTAAVRALARFYEIEIPEHELPGLVLAVETEELGIPGGLMDRVVQAYGGTMYMDLSAERLASCGYGDYRRLPTDNLPPLFVAYRVQLAEGSEVVHTDLRRRFEAGEPLVRETMGELAVLADRARDLIEANRGIDIGPLMDRNLDLRDRVAPLSAGNRQLVDCGRGLGAHVKFAGSGGAVVGAYDGDPARLESLRTAYGQIGAEFLVPVID